MFVLGGSFPKLSYREALARVLAVLNGRARGFRFTAINLFQQAQCATIFDRNHPFEIAKIDRSPTESLDASVRRAGVFWSTEQASEGNYHSYVGTPLCAENGDVFGVLCHFDEGCAQLEESERAGLEQAAREISRWLLQNAPRESNLPQSDSDRHRLLTEEQRARREADNQRERLRSIIASAPVAMATWRGPEHTYECANDLYLGFLQRGNDVVGKTLAQVFPERTKDHPVMKIFDKVYTTGRPYVNPEYAITLMVDGRPQKRFCTFNLVPTHDINGQVDGLTVCVIDVSDSVHARDLLAKERDRANTLAVEERASRELAEQERDRSEFLLRIAGSLGEGLDLAPSLQRLVDVIVPPFADFASVWTLGEARAWQRTVFAPAEESLARGDDAQAAATAWHAVSPVQQVAESGQPVRIDDLPRWMHDAHAPQDAAVIARRGLFHSLTVPVLLGKEIVAILSLSRRKGAPFTAIDLTILESVARQTARAFENSRLYAETLRLRKTAEQATIAKDQFLAHVSHDLRNPLGSILGWAALLRANSKDQAQVAKGLDIIERNAKAQVQLIEDLLDVSRIASGKLQLEVAAEDVHQAIDTALDSARLTAHAKGVHLLIDIERDVGSIIVDPERFRQVVWNLVSNAVKFTPAGGTVRVSAQREGSQLAVVVADNGRGIAPEFLPHIFERFEQAEKGAKRTGGLGLGLAIVRYIVELHGGTVEVESDGEGKGARFTVRLPIRAAIRAAEPGAGPEQGKAPRALDNVHALVVDDEADAREVVTEILQQAGASVITADSVEHAIAAFKERPPNIIVSDINMPERDGKSLLRQIRTLSESEGGRVPAVALTALARSKDRIDVLLAGFNSHVPKPVEPKELVMVIASLLGREVSEDSMP